MYQKKCDIINKIQSYHQQVGALYYEMYKKAEDHQIKLLLLDLYRHEKFREQYLEKHRVVARAMNSWLEFPCDQLSDQISACFKNINTRADLTMEEIIHVELHFDDCLIKLYNILSSENTRSESLINIFYYMLKKTKKEKNLLTNMLVNSGNISRYKHQIQPASL